MTAHYERKHLEVNAMRRRMVTLPEGAEVLFTDGMWVPLAIVEGVHILPGIPRLFPWSTQFQINHTFLRFQRGILK